MSIELTDDNLNEIREHALDRMHASLIEYDRLLGAVREKLPTVTDEAIAIVKERFTEGTHQDDGRAQTHAALFCALYQLAMDKGKECITLLKAGRADAEVLRNLMWVTSSAFESLAGLAVVINGGPLSQSIVDDALEQRRAQDDKLRDIQQAYDKLRAETGKAPSQRAVTDRSGYSRETVRDRWALLKPTKPDQ